MLPGVAQGPAASVVGALVAVGKRVGVRVVEERVVPVAPGKLLQGEEAADSRADCASAAGCRLTLVRMRRWGYGTNSGCPCGCSCAFMWALAMQTATPGMARTTVRIFQVLAAKDRR